MTSCDDLIAIENGTYVMTNLELETYVGELNRSLDLPVYDAFDRAWIAVVKIANTLPGSKEHDRMLGLLELLSDDAVREVLHSPAVHTLLGLDPPLESVLTFPHERLDRDRTAVLLQDVRKHHAGDPKLALQRLAEVLKRIRNRRAHGFKTPEGPRDNEILGAALARLRLIGLSAAEVLKAAT